MFWTITCKLAHQNKEVPLLGNKFSFSSHLCLQAVSAKKKTTIVITALEILGRVPFAPLFAVFYKFGILSQPEKVTGVGLWHRWLAWTLAPLTGLDSGGLIVILLLVQLKYYLAHFKNLTLWLNCSLYYLRFIIYMNELTAQLAKAWACEGMDLGSIPEICILHFLTSLFQI